MLRRTRVSRKPDVQRLGQALARPGIDTRVWIALGFVVAVSTDSSGSWADVLLETGDQLTCFMGAGYAGPGIGAYFPLSVDDQVLVAIPSGEPDNGGVVIARLWSASDAPPQEAENDGTNAVIRMSSQKTLRIVTDDDVYIEWAPTTLKFNAPVAVTKAGQAFGVQGPNGQFYQDLIAQHFIGGIDLAPPIATQSGATTFILSANSTDSSGVLTMAAPTNTPVLGTVTFAKPYPSKPKVLLTPVDAVSIIQTGATYIVYIDDSLVTPTGFSVSCINAATPLPSAKYAYKVEG